jgi:hypothetical protein
MKEQSHSLEFIKRRAKKLKKELNISHTDALEFISKELGYCNWIHCHKSFSQKVSFEANQDTGNFELNFTDWLSKHKNRNSPLGDLATDMSRDDNWPLYDTLEEYEYYLDSQGACYDAVETLKRGWKSYKNYLKRKRNPALYKAKSKPVVRRLDSRKIVFVKNAKLVPYTKRSTEEFSLGSPAWISWEGKKAIPVTVVKVDETHYSVRIERPIKKQGNVNSLFRDEVRSTPELACENYVTW